MNRLHRLATAGVIAFAVFGLSRARLRAVVVFDPNNYAQNVLTAARALQQINNQIVSLQKPGADADQPGEESGPRCRSRRCCVGTVDPAYPAVARPGSTQSPMISNRSTVRSPRLTAPASSSIPDQALIANAQTRWQNAMGPASRTPCGHRLPVVGNLNTNRTRCQPLSPRARRRPARCKRARPAINSWPCRPSNSRISQRLSRPMDARKTWSPHSTPPLRTRQGAIAPFPDAGAAINPQPYRCSTDEHENTRTAPDRGSRGAHRSS